MAAGVGVGNDWVVGLGVGSAPDVGVADAGWISPMGVNVAAGVCVGSDPAAGVADAGVGAGLILHAIISTNAIQSKHFRPATVSILRSFSFR
ncbi:MAG: hypothetical protein L0331_14435 [Chloroflexi bacterium]|nr:hypothetical protein [Chloroflexota bacterium]